MSKSHQSITVTVPIPHRSLSPNARSHWATKANHKKFLRKKAAFEAVIARYMSRNGVDYNWTLATVSVLWLGRTRNCERMDRDNAIGSLKAAIDGCCDGGILVNDHGLRWGLVAFAVDKDNPRVELTFTEDQ